MPAINPVFASVSLALSAVKAIFADVATAKIVGFIATAFASVNPVFKAIKSILHQVGTAALRDISAKFSSREPVVNSANALGRGRKGRRCENGKKHCSAYH